MSHWVHRIKPSTAWVALATLAWLMATAWLRPLMLPDEGRYVGVAWEMLRSGEWLTPTLNGLPYFHKPPLFYWITATAMSVLGPTTLAARAAPLLGAWLGAMALYGFVRRWVGAQPAAWMLLLLIVQPLFYLGGQFANLDMLVAGCITATVLLMAHATLCRENALPYRHARLGGYALAAIGVLAKGLIGLVLPGLILILWLMLRRRSRSLLSLLSGPGALLFGLLAAPWFVVMAQRFPDFLHYFFIVQHFQRFAQSGFNNMQPWWFYPAVLLVLNLPWLAGLQALRARAYWTDPQHGPLRILMLVWLVVVVGFFSMPASKLVGYVLPGVPPLVYLIVDGFLTQGPWRKRWQGASAVLAVTLSWSVIAWLMVKPMHSSRLLGAALATQRSDETPIFMLSEYYFDLPFYARLSSPTQVVDAWDDAHNIAQHDNWRKELADAGQFDRAAAQATLITQADFSSRICANPNSWVVGPPSALAQYPWLRAAHTAAHTQETTLWHLQATPAHCAKTPNAD